MSIYIKGMDMPKGCYDCPLLDGEYGDCKVGATGLYDPYRDDCPLTEVSEPHGRLIDADVLAKQCKPRDIADEVWEESNEYKRITNAQTIIERSDK